MAADLDDKKAQSKDGSGWETVKTLFYAFLIAVVIRTFAYEPFSIPSGSMIPTLLVHDYLFVSKLSYGYSKHSLPFSLPLFAGRLFYEQPELGDVAVFKTPQDNKTDFIKRVVGLPGDTVSVRGGILHINDAPVMRTPMGQGVCAIENGRRIDGNIYRERLPNGAEHLICETSDSGPMDNTRQYKVPPDHFFMMGDNRDNSSDSRVIGYVHKDNLVGRADIIFFSSDSELWKVWRWPMDIRGQRMFKVIN